MRPGIHPEFFEEAPVYCNGCGTRDISPAILSRICDRCGPPLRPAPPARGTHTAPSAFLPRREQVLTVGGTKKEYYVELWSGNHPFYQGVTSAIVVDEGAVNKFKKRYAGLDSLSKVSTVSETIKAKKEQ